MKTHSLILPALAALLAASLTAFAVPVSTAFNYQGRLDHNGAVANGLFDLRFEIYTEWTGGTPAVPAIEVQGLAVSGGLISADLDFGGATVFDGRAYYLQTYARQQGSPTYVLVPGGRTAIRPAPYSIHALSAASVKDGGVTSASLASGAVTSAKLAASAVGLTQLNTAGAPASGQVLGYNGTGLSWMAPASGPWQTNGSNAYYNGGLVGIGTSTPSHGLTIMATATPPWTAYGWGGAMSLPNKTAIAWQTNTAGQRFGMGHTDGGFVLFRTASDPGNPNGNVSFDLTVGDSGSITIPGDVGIGSNVGISGNVGIGTGSSPNRKLKIQASGYGFEHTDGSVSMGTYAGAGGGWIGTQSNHPLHFETNGGSADMTILPNGNVGIGTTSPTAKLDVRGDIYSEGLTSVRTLTIRGGADLAEPFAMSHPGVEPGTVVVIDAANPGKLKTSTRAYDKKVAGIVSGANGIQPGISMIQEDKLEAGENVALSGRVFVKADTSGGSIEPGDLLTTSSTAGRAMKAADHSRAQGAIIGKAMTPLPGGDGMVLVLVTLQ